MSLLLAILPLLAGLEHARTLFNVTFEIVLVSLLVQGWTLVPVARRLRQVVPARLGPVERSRARHAGLCDHELVCYRIAENSPIAAGATLPRWSRPSLVVRKGESMRIREAGPLQPGDLVYLIVPDERIPLLDRIFAATRRREIRPRILRRLRADARRDAVRHRRELRRRRAAARLGPDRGRGVVTRIRCGADGGRPFAAGRGGAHRARLDIGGRVAEVGLALKSVGKRAERGQEARG